MEPKILELAKKVDEIGGKAYLTGGYVRDLIIGRENKDIDICITGLENTDQFLITFPEAKIIGKSFPVFKLYGMDIAFARKERKIDIGKKGFEIITDKNITIEEDLKRRDFTINAIAIDILKDEIIDPYGGKEDIQNKKIKAVSEAFSEDPSRVYRGARFSAQLDMEVDKDTIKMMNELKEELQTLNPEQVFEELRKVLSSKQPSRFFITLKEADVLEVHFKEIYDLIGVEQPEQYHPEGDVFNHTMQAIDKGAQYIEGKPNKEEIMFAILVHDFGKAYTPRDNWPHHHGHDMLGAAPIKKMCKRLKLPTKWELAGVESAQYHMQAGFFYKMTPGKQMTLIEKFGGTRSTLGLEGIETVASCDGKKVEFAQIGKEIMQTIKYNDTIKRFSPEKIRAILHQKRILLLNEKLKGEK